jgi:hypothetical protein
MKTGFRGFASHSRFELQSIFLADCQLLMKSFWAGNHFKLTTAFNAAIICSSDPHKKFFGTYTFKGFKQ